MNDVVLLENFDVCICGAGLAGLCLARQLTLEMPELKIVVVDQDKRPLPSGTHKVGESLIEVGSHYLMHTLGLGEYLGRVHKPKCGLRWFTRDGHQPIEDRTETGAPDFPLIPALQLDRGLFENDLRQMCIDSGVQLLEGVRVNDIELDPGDVHRVKVASATGPERILSATWVVDAMGRRRFLASKLGLKEPVEHKASACWWRVDGEWDVSRAVPSPRKGSDWQSKELGKRWYATNHFMGKGYWVWVIPLANHTSIGIVGDESEHPVAERSNEQRALAWLEKYEPHLANWLGAAKVADFLALKNFAYTSTRFYSEERWALLGEAALFADPYYSTGSDLIAVQNNIVVRLIRMERQGRFNARVARDYNEFLAEYFRGILAIYEGQYGVFGNEYCHYIKTMWDFDFLTGPTGKIGFGPHVLDDPDDIPSLTKTLKQWSELNIAMQRLVREWAERRPGKAFERGAPGSPIGEKGLLVPNMQIFQTFTDQLRMRQPEVLVEQCRGTFWRFVTERARWVFRNALRDVALDMSSEEAALVERALNEPVNVLAVSLTPSRWEADGLFDVQGGESSDRAEADASQMEYIIPAAPPAVELVGGYPRATDCFAGTVGAAPDDEAVVCGEQVLSRSALQARTDRVKEALFEKHPYGRVAFVGEDRIGHLIAMCGAMSADCCFSAIDDPHRTEGMLQASLPQLVVCSDPQVREKLADRWTSVLLRDLEQGEVSAVHSPEMSATDKMRPCYQRFQTTSSGNKLRTMTHFTMMNWLFYVELSLRQQMPVNAAETATPLVLLSSTLGGQDWLLPLAFGGTLVLSPEGGLSADVLRRADDLARKKKAQLVVSGSPETLLGLEISPELGSRLLMLAVDRVLTAAESARLSLRSRGVVNSGILEWGHEELWGEAMRKLTPTNKVASIAAE